MKNILCKFYNYIIGLKKHLVMHIIIIPQAVLILLSYFICNIYLLVNLIKDPDGEGVILFLIAVLLLVLYFVVVFISIVLAVVTSIFMKITKKQIEIKVPFFQSKFYNIVCFASIINFIIMVVTLPFGIIIFYALFLLTFPTIQAYYLLSWLIQHLF